MIWDPEASKTLSASTHKQKVDFNIFEGITVKGLPSHTIGNGIVKFKRGELQVEPGQGKYIKRPAFHPMFSALGKAAALNPPLPVERE